MITRYKSAAIDFWMDPQRHMGWLGSKNSAPKLMWLLRITCQKFIKTHQRFDSDEVFLFLSHSLFIVFHPPPLAIIMIFSRSSNSKRKSHTPSSTSTPLLSRLNVSTPAVYYTNQNNSSASNLSPRATDMNTSASYGGGGSPIPTPSTSWTSEMSVLADKIRDDSAHTVDSLDRRSISQGMKLVAIAADEYEDGNNTVALDIYLSGIDKILMALPSRLAPLVVVSPQKSKPPHP